MRSVVRVLLLAAVLAAPGAKSARAGAWVPAPGEYAVSITGSRYSSDDIRNVDEERTMLFGSGLNEQRTATASLEIGWKKQTSFWFDLPFVSETRRLGDGNAWPTETGFGDLALGFRRRISQGTTSTWAVEAGWKAPLGYASDPRVSPAGLAYLGSQVPPGLSREDSLAKIEELAREAGHPTFGQGQQDLQAMLLYGQSLTGLQGFVELGAGYRYRFEDPADQILLEGDAGFWLGHSFLIAGHYSGAIAAGDGTTAYDAYTEHQVGPELRFRVDDRCDVYAGSMHTPAGKNVLQRDTFYVGIAFRQTRLNRLQGFLGGARQP